MSLIPCDNDLLQLVINSSAISSFALQAKLQQAATELTALRNENSKLHAENIGLRAALLSAENELAFAAIKSKIR